MKDDNVGDYPRALVELGWDSWFEQQLKACGEPDLMPARVICEYGQSCDVSCELGDVSAEISGKMRFETALASGFPAVGDWVAVRLCPGEMKVIIHALLPRKSKLARRIVSRNSVAVRNIAGRRTDEQILAANVDTVLVVCGLDRDFNLRRIERYLVLANESGVAPVVLLNKADVCADIAPVISHVGSVAPGVPVHAISALSGTGTDSLHQYLRPGGTTILLGSSGAGKSTLVNRLLGSDCQITAAVREDDQRGRHTTVRRELMLVPDSRGAIIDTPGLRELQVIDEGAGLGSSFDDIESLALLCRFRDCAHGSEPGCAVHNAIDEGALDGGHFANYLKLQNELRRSSIHQDPHAQLAEKRKDVLFSRHKKKTLKSRR